VTDRWPGDSDATEDEDAAVRRALMDRDGQSQTEA
jgi:hypothetical protein